jgi:hypothetical protein
MKPAYRDLALSLVLGVVGLLLFHLDHLVATYSGWDDPLWWLHVLVDGGYILIYAALAWVGLRGWRVWRQMK